MGSRLKHVLARQWTLIQELGRHRRGCTASGLVEALGAHRATVYRDLDELRTCGVPIDSRNVNGEARYMIAGGSLPPLTATATQLAALRLARRMMTHLDGTQMTAELDALLKPYAALASESPTVSTRRAPALAPDLVAELDRAIRQARRVRIRVRTRKEKRPTWRLLDPLSLRHDKGTLYLVAFDHDRCDYRTFKVLRMSQVQKLPDKVAPHADFDEEAFFAHSVKVWSGEPIDVRVRFTATVASIVHEYPLVEGQTLEDAADGGVVLTARVAGIPEAMRWVLGWGRDAEVLAPRELREAVAQQVKGAAARYAGASVRAHGKARAVADRAQRAPDAE